VKALGYDPVIIAMFAELARVGILENDISMAGAVIERFVSSAEAEAGVSTGFLQADYEGALLALGRCMLSSNAE
jgi:hypothetical protein